MLNCTANKTLLNLPENDRDKRGGRCEGYEQMEITQAEQE